VFTNPLPINRHIVGRFGSRGNVFTESLPSNGSIRHIIVIIIYSYETPLMIPVYLSLLLITKPKACMTLGYVSENTQPHVNSVKRAE
jgi:hypothetical protein